VTKYEHWLGEAFNFSRAETALLCVLLLRGPQTPGELKARTERMVRFDTLGDVEAAIDLLCEAGYAQRLERRPGQKEERYMHLLGGASSSTEPAVAEAHVQDAGAYEHQSPVRPAQPDNGLADRVAALEAAVASLQEQLRELLG
jgi:uncharacterized protein YceH (UPF0502 family)